MRKSAFRTSILGLAKLLRTYDLYAKWRFNSNLDKLEGSPEIQFERYRYRRIGVGWESLMIVVPSAYKTNWEPAKGNFYFELFQSAKEKYPDKSIFFHIIKKGNYEWKSDLNALLARMQPDVILMSPEIDPNETGEWTISQFVGDLNAVWNGRIVYLMFDSIYPLHMWRVERLARLRKDCTIVAIDRKLKRSRRLDTKLVGPYLLPISIMSLTLLREQIAEKITSENLTQIEVSFVGKIYPYREQRLNAIRKNIPSLEINPQYKMNDPSSYLSYITAIKLSKYSINLSQAGGIRKKQLKSRVLECLLFDSILVSDERRISKEIGITDESYIYFRDFKGVNMDKLTECASKKIFSSYSESTGVNSFFEID